MAQRATAASSSRTGPIGPISGFLERFRRSGGVPAAVGGELSSELAPVFAALDGLEREVAELRRRRETATARRTQQTDEEVERILAEARGRAESEQDDAFQAGVHVAVDEAARIGADAEREAEGIVERGRERVPALVAEILEHVLEAGS